MRKVHRYAIFLKVGVTGFEPAASCSQSRRATNCATPRTIYYTMFFDICQVFRKVGSGRLRSSRKPFIIDFLAVTNLRNYVKFVIRKGRIICYIGSRAGTAAVSMQNRCSDCDRSLVADADAKQIE